MSVITVITDGGFDLLRAAPGHKLIYTRAVCGSGHVEKTQLATLTEVSGYVMDLSIVDFKPTESAATLRLQLDNSKAPTEFQLYQIGVYAKLVDGETEVLGETLLQVMQYEQPDIVRAIPHISEFVVNTLMGQADKVEGIIDLAAYVSIRQFSNTVESIDQSINIVDGKISDHCLDMEDPHNTTAEQVTTLSGDSVETSLSKKANADAVYGTEYALRRNESIDQLFQPGNYRMFNAVGTLPLGVPVGDNDLALSVTKIEVDIQIQDVRSVRTGISYSRRYFDGWTAWEPVATATPPQKLDLPLLDGLVARNVIGTETPAQNTYCKDQFGWVTVTASYCRSDTADDISNATTVCTIPVGYRTTEPIEREATVVYQGDIHPAAGVVLHPNGDIRVNLEKNVQYRRGKFQFSFLASLPDA